MGAVGIVWARASATSTMLPAVVITSNEHEKNFERMLVCSVDAPEEYKTSNTPEEVKNTFSFLDS